MTVNQYIEQLMIRYLLNEINEEEMVRLESWINKSDENKAYFFNMKGISDLSQRHYWSETQKEESWQRMLNRMDKKPTSGISRWKKPVRPARWMNYAAILVLAFAIGWTANLIYTGKMNFGQQPEQLSYNEIQVGKGGRGNTILLADGTKVILNASTTFRYPDHFATTERTVYLDGEARFDVAKNEDKPFIVRLKKQDVTVLGTTFNVMAYGDEQQSIVTLLEGSIALEAFNEEGESMSKMYLKPNQQAISDNLTGSVSIHNVMTPLAESWIQGTYKFKDETLQTIVKRLEKLYDVSIHLEDVSLSKMRYTGTFSLSQDIREVLRIIDHKKQLSIRQSGNEIYINKKISINH